MERELLTTYINRAQEISSTLRAQQPDARIISQAVQPENAKYPQRAPILGIALLVGTVLALPPVLLQLAGWRMKRG